MKKKFLIILPLVNEEFSLSLLLWVPKKVIGHCPRTHRRLNYAKIKYLASWPVSMSLSVTTLVTWSKSSKNNDEFIFSAASVHFAKIIVKGAQHCAAMDINNTGVVFLAVLLGGEKTRFVMRSWVKSAVNIVMRLQALCKSDQKRFIIKISVL